MSTATLTASPAYPLDDYLRGYRDAARLRNAPPAVDTYDPEQHSADYNRGYADAVEDYPVIAAGVRAMGTLLDTARGVS